MCGGEHLGDTLELGRIGYPGPVVEVGDREIIFLELKVAQAEFVARLDNKRGRRVLLDDFLVIVQRPGVVSQCPANLTQTIERPVPVSARWKAGEKSLHGLRGLVVL